LLVKQRARGGEDATWAGLQDSDGSSCDRPLCSRCSANRPLSFTSMSAVAHQSHVQATLACTTTVYPYSSPVSPDVDICCVAGWRLMFKIMRTRCLSSGWHTSTDNIVLGVLPTKNIGPISILPNTANIAQYPISQYQYRSNPTRQISFIIVSTSHTVNVVLRRCCADGYANTMGKNLPAVYAAD